MRFFVVVLFIACISCSGSIERSFPARDSENTPDTAAANPDEPVAPDEFVAVDDTPSPDADRAKQGLPARFAVMSDTHVQEGLPQAVFAAAVELVISEQPDFAIISGDLTANGLPEEIELFITEAKRLEEAGIPLYVVAGNHDLISYSYGELYVLLDEIAQKGVVQYEPGGFSFTVEPVEGLVLIGLQSALEKNTKGEIPDTRINWMAEQITTAQERGAVAVACTHHNLIEHYSKEALLVPDMMVSDYQTVAQKFENTGLSVLFSGHAHATDTVLRQAGAKLYELETASLPNFPSPIRFVTIDAAGVLKTETRSVTQVNWDTGGEVWETYNERRLEEMLEASARSMLSRASFSESETVISLPALVGGMKAHVLGDEAPDTAMQERISELKNSSNFKLKLAGDMAESFWKDGEPADNNFSVPLR